MGLIDIWFLDDIGILEPFFQKICPQNFEEKKPFAFLSHKRHFCRLNGAIKLIFECKKHFPVIWVPR